MTALAFFCALIAAPMLEISIAPDQPVPYVYADEPVILQIKSSEDGKAAGQVSITGDDGKSTAIALPTIPLRANGSHWQPLEGAPPAKGRFHVHVALVVDDTKLDTDLVYCRIERPGDEVRAPVRVRVDAPGPTVLHALRGIPLRETTLPIATPELQALLASASLTGFRVAIALDSAAAADLPSLTKLAATLGDKVSAWRVPVPEIKVEALEPLAAALRDAGSRAQIEAALSSGPVDIDAYLAAGLGRTAFKVFLSPNGLAPVRAAFENAGYEGFRLQSIIRASNEKDDGSNRGSVARDILGSQFAGGTRPEIDVSEVYSQGAFGESYSLLSAMAHRLNGHEYFDELPMTNRARAVIFRRGDAWIAAMWATGQPAVQMLPIGDATGIAVTDADNNALPIPKVEERSLRMALTNSPIYVSGKGGPLLAATARASARKEAESFAKNKAFQANLPPEVIEVMKPIAAANFSRVDRVSFFALLRIFPVLEQKWHEGTLPRGSAVPAMASLSRLVRGLCVIEQDSGEPFIELLQDTVARCGNYQSQYLTSTSGSAEKHERADWLLAEVARLTADAKALADDGRGIEAVGVASIAEWRARSLEFATNAAPLGAPEPERVQPAPAAKMKPAPKNAQPAQKKPARPSAKKR